MEEDKFSTHEESFFLKEIEWRKKEEEEKECWPIRAQRLWFLSSEYQQFIAGHVEGQEVFIFV